MGGRMVKTLIAWTSPRYVLVTLAVAMVLILATSGLVSAAGNPVNEAAALQMTTAEPIQQFEAEARLQLHISGLGLASFRADAHVQGDGLIRNMIYEMWLAPSNGAQVGNGILLHADRAKEECDEDNETGEEGDCELLLDLQGFLAQAPFDVTTLEGLTIHIRENLIRRNGTRPILLTGTVTGADLRFEAIEPITSNGVGGGV